MKVILYDAVVKLGSPGEIKDVSSGFARNFLFPRKLAFPATEGFLKRWEVESKTREVKLGKDVESAKAVAQTIEALGLLQVGANAGKEGQLFGSITNQMIAEALSAKAITIDKKNIVIESPIKTLGEYSISIRLHAQVLVPLKIEVFANPS